MAVLLKQNAVRLAQQHRMTCPGESCAVSLFMLQLLLDHAGIELTLEEREEFA